MDAEEGNLIEKAMNGDEQSFVELVKMHQQRIFALSCSLVGDYHSAEDAAQETFMRAFKGMGTLKDAGKFGTWLSGIAYRVSKEFIREDKKTKAIFKSGIPNNIAFLVKEGASASFKKSVIDASNQLPDEARALLALKYLEGLSYAEIAQVMDIDPKTVKSRLFTARRQLREKLGNYIAAE